MDKKDDLFSADLFGEETEQVTEVAQEEAPVEASEAVTEAVAEVAAEPVETVEEGIVKEGGVYRVTRPGAAVVLRFAERSDEELYVYFDNIEFSNGL
ncbi:MAG: hypothetical protein IKV42_00145, partial [Burkholderiaceae bacterium]|nr:hypothetical protein [Burkholderiaceae bacterium]